MAKNKSDNKAASNAANDLVSKFGHEAEYLFTPRYTEDSDGKMIQTNPNANFNNSQRAQIMQEAAIMLMAQFVALQVTSVELADFDKLTSEAIKKFMLYSEGYVQQINRMKKEELKNGTNPSQGS
jgi:hypothetical protein